ncbi:Histidine protein methyltransferase 1 like [Sesbania bispinosa]|nr:Histidine protein methyltransferase 1 like [Sesbania bispinosa]
MAAANSEVTMNETMNNNLLLLLCSGFGIFDDPAQQVPAIPPPPCVEVLASDSEVPSSAKHNVESVNLDGVTLLKGG